MKLVNIYISIDKKTYNEKRNLIHRRCILILRSKGA